MNIYWHDSNPNKEVFVSGSFDLWEKKHRLEFKGGSYSIKINLPKGDNSNTIFYKFVVDGEWQVSNEDPITVDESGNVNNFFQINNTNARVSFNCNIDEEDTSMVEISPVNSRVSISSGYTCVSLDHDIHDLSTSLTTSSSTIFSRIRQMFN